MKNPKKFNVFVLYLKYLLSKVDIPQDILKSINNTLIEIEKQLNK